MAEIHHLITQHGRDHLLQRASSKEERQIIDVAAEVMAAESERLGITYSGFCLTALPHRAIDEERWIRRGHRVTLVVQSGVDRNGASLGVPFGSRARMILLYLQTRAIQTDSREVELGRSMNEWLERMGLSIGGKTYREVKEQAARISSCSLSFFWDLPEGGELRANNSIVSRAITFASTDTRQGQLWTDTVELSETFFKALKEHPVPVLETAIRQISGRSMAIDAYIWLAYRLHRIEKPTVISWSALFEQFGSGFGALYHFKPEFMKALRLAVAAYPEARIDIEASGVTLYPSLPPVAKTTVPVLLPQAAGAAR